jgi:hypothetical protein
LLFGTETALDRVSGFGDFDMAAVLRIVDDDNDNVDIYS